MEMSYKMNHPRRMAIISLSVSFESFKQEKALEV